MDDRITQVMGVEVIDKALSYRFNYQELAETLHSGINYDFKIRLNFTDYISTIFILSDYARYMDFVKVQFNCINFSEDFHVDPDDHICRVTLGKPSESYSLSNVGSCVLHIHFRPNVPAVDTYNFIVYCNAKEPISF
jgi:hypothetical protein